MLKLVIYDILNVKKCKKKKKKNTFVTLKTTMREGGDTNGEVCACFLAVCI